MDCESGSCGDPLKPSSPPISLNPPSSNSSSTTTTQKASGLARHLPDMSLRKAGDLAGTVFALAVSALTLLRLWRLMVEKPVQSVCSTSLAGCVRMVGWTVSWLLWRDLMEFLPWGAGAIVVGICVGFVLEYVCDYGRISFVVLA